MRVVATASPAVRPIGTSHALTAFVIARSLSVIGTAFALLGATGAATATGDAARGALNSGIFLALLFLGMACSMPYAPTVASRSGVRPAYAVVLAIGALAYGVVGIAMLGGVPTMTALLIAAPIAGASCGMTGPYETQISKAYFASETTAHAYALLSVVSAIAFGVGGLVAGVTLTHIAPAWGLVIDAVLTAVLAITVAVAAPPVEPAVPRRPDRPFHNVWRALATNRRLRWTTVLGASSAFFLAPVLTLVVPLAEDLQHKPSGAGAGLLLSAFAVGGLLTPTLVKAAVHRATSLLAGEVTGALAGATLIVLGSVSLVPDFEVDLIAWVGIGIAFGAFWSATKALVHGAAAEAGAPEDAVTNLAAMLTVAMFAAPVGSLLCSIAIGSLSAEAAVLAAGVSAVAWNLVSIRLLRRASDEVATVAA